MIDALIAGRLHGQPIALPSSTSPSTWWAPWQAAPCTCTAQHSTAQQRHTLRQPSHDTSSTTAARAQPNTQPSTCTTWHQHSSSPRAWLAQGTTHDAQHPQHSSTSSSTMHLELRQPSHDTSSTTAAPCTWSAPWQAPAPAQHQPHLPSTAPEPLHQHDSSTPAGQCLSRA